MKKKSQITLYFILGLLIVGVVALGFFFSTKMTIEETEQQEQLGFTQQDLENVIESCIQSIMLETIDSYGLCNTEDYFKQEINRNLASCIDFSSFRDRSYEVLAENTPDHINVGITEENIIVRIKYPIVLSRSWSKISFSEKEYSLQRETSVLLSEGKTQNDVVLKSRDNDFQLKIPKGTEVSFPNNENRISVYMEEQCPDDPSVLGEINYRLKPDNTEFSPFALITIKYEDEQVSHLAKEESFKIAVIEDNTWKLLQSSADSQDNIIKVSVAHFSDYAASCLGSNKYGMQLISHDTYTEEQAELILDRDLSCVNVFSGSCGFVKYISYLEPDIQNSNEHYKNVVSKIYDKELFPLLTIMEEPSEGGIYSHPGDCTEIDDCQHGEDKSGDNKPVYSYTGTAQDMLNFVDTIHSDNPQWPLFIEIWNEPNLAKNWNDVSLTDYQIEEYARYFVTMATSVKSLDHSDSIEIMPAGLAPTLGQKVCVVDTLYIKDATKAAEMAADDFIEAYCEDLGMLHGGNSYMAGNKNMCQPSELQDLPEPTSCNPVCGPGEDPSDDNCFETDAKRQKCIQDEQRDFVLKIKPWYDVYVEKEVDAAFGGISIVSGTYQDYEDAKKIKEIIENKFKKYCYEKITEVSPNEFWTKMIQSQHGGDVCKMMDMYADHSYPSSSDLDTYPGGSNPFGMESYKERFELVKNLCQANGDFNLHCISADETDTDKEGIIDLEDNCPNEPNEDQLNWDHDDEGDVCDDSDGDGYLDSEDLCPNDDSQNEGTDTDGDGWADSCDNCPYDANHDQKDLDEDDIGDVCDEQTDSDGVPNIGYPQKCSVNDETNIITECTDNCPYNDNPDQLDEDGDGIGDVCDNCLNVVNVNQEDRDNDGQGDHCDDSDGDGFHDNEDLCPETYSEQNLPEVCQPQDLCIGKIMITETAWAPHHSTRHVDSDDLDVDDYVSQMQQAYDKWGDDENVLAVIPFHLGERDQYVDELLTNYSWVEKICTDECVGKEIFNTIGEIQNPIFECGVPAGPEGPCTEHVVEIWNMGAYVGKPRTMQYKCYPCEEKVDGKYEYGEPPSKPEETHKVTFANGEVHTYEYFGMDECFGDEKIDPGTEIKLGETTPVCQDIDGTQREALPCKELEIDGQDYVVKLLCDRGLDAIEARYSICGTVEQCDYNAGNCCDMEQTEFGLTTSCKIPEANS